MQISLPLLVHSNPEKRNLELQKLNYELLNSLESQFDSDKLAKGIFFAYWMTPNPQLQEILANKIAKFCAQSIPFTKAFMQAISKSWFQIDRLRLDKVHLLVKTILLEQDVNFELVPRSPTSLFAYCIRETIPRLTSIPTDFFVSAIELNEPTITNAVISIFSSKLENLEDFAYSLYKSKANLKTKEEVKKAIINFGKSNNVEFKFENIVTQFKKEVLPFSKNNSKPDSQNEKKNSTESGKISLKKNDVEDSISPSLGNSETKTSPEITVDIPAISGKSVLDTGFRISKKAVKKLKKKINKSNSISNICDSLSKNVSSDIALPLSESKSTQQTDFPNMKPLIADHASVTQKGKDSPKKKDITVTKEQKIHLEKFSADTFTKFHQKV